MSYFNRYPKDAYEPDNYGIAQGIAFHLPSHRRFIPNSWLLYSKLNEGQTQLQLHYTHSVVTVTGTHLARVHELVETFTLKAVREMPATADANDPTVARIEITEKTEE